MVKIGILSLQGDFLEHYQILREINNVEPVYVKKPEDLSKINALIIPGGESTTIGMLIDLKGFAEPIKKLAEDNIPILGVCAGAVLLASSVIDRFVGETNQPLLNLMNISVVRNIYGRQKNSFITDVHIEGIGVVKAAFIRAPGIIDAWGSARIIGYIEHPVVNKIGVAAVQDNLMAITFHPEITGDKKIYEYLVEKINELK